jgi:hypothetical protein
MPVRIDSIKLKNVYLLARFSMMFSKRFRKASTAFIFPWLISLLLIVGWVTVKNLANSSWVSPYKRFLNTVSAVLSVQLLIRESANRQLTLNSSFTSSQGVLMLRVTDSYWMYREEHLILSLYLHRHVFVIESDHL